MRLLTAILCSLVALPALGQTITFSSDITQANGVATPTLTWSTSPPADDCIASGDWLGSKGPAGTETMAPIVTSASYRLTCDWSSGSVTLAWVAPTMNTDGTLLTDLAGFWIYQGTVDGGPYDVSIEVPDPDATSVTLDFMQAGTYYFVGSAYNAAGLESALSPQTSASVAPFQAQESVAVTVNPVPLPPENFRAE